jgi:phenylacetate-CoA ligase
MLKEYVKGLVLKNMTLDNPHWLQELFDNFFSSWANPFNIKCFRFYGFLTNSQYFPRWELEQYQREKIKLLLNHVYKHVSYYTDIFIKNKLTPDDFDSIVDLKKIPVLTKEDVVKNLDKLLSRKIDKKYLFSIRTSGTTGTPIQFYRDIRYEYINTAFALRRLACLGITRYARKLTIWLRPFVLDKIEDEYIYAPQIKSLTLATIRNGLPQWGRKLELIRRFKPAYILASPSVLYDLACYLQAHRIHDIQLQCVISCFENILPYQKELIQEQLRCKVYNYYSCQEFVITASECLCQNGMHVDMERGITEIVDGKGELLADGKSGRILATPLHIFAMPFIRYDTGDIGAISPLSCSCGRGLPLLDPFDGRMSEFIRYRDKRICPSTFSSVLCRFSHIKECQLIQEKETELVMNIVKRDGFTENDARELIKCLRHSIDDGLKVMLNYVDHIPRTQMGKFKFVINKFQ